jgi:uncharacterized 2Fe-2S/4Fe-4S cluster protein (DUF4445 family)
MACLIQIEAIDPSGRLKNPHQAPTAPKLLKDRHKQRDGIAAIQLAENLFFTQKDIRQFQLAKSAIQTGIEMLISAAGIGIDQLEKIVIGGAFGHHLREESLRQIGMIPIHYKGKVEFAGNTNRTGSVLLRTARDVLTGCCAGCAVPVGLFKTMQVAAGLALPKDITINMESSNG